MITNYRTTDPPTSREAGLRVIANGKSKSDREKCLEVVLRKPGLTSGEIAKELNVDRYIPSRRLPELRRLGHLRNGQTRKCTVHGSNMMTWYPIL